MVQTANPLAFASDFISGHWTSGHLPDQRCAFDMPGHLPCAFATCQGRMDTLVNIVRQNQMNLNPIPHNFPIFPRKTKESNAQPGSKGRGFTWGHQPHHPTSTNPSLESSSRARRSSMEFSKPPTSLELSNRWGEPCLGVSESGLTPRYDGFKEKNDWGYPIFRQTYDIVDALGLTETLPIPSHFSI